MNFETKYLIRWGIPGWLMILSLLPYFLVSYNVFFMKHIISSSNIFTIGVAAITLFGVPLGHFLNQIHHSVFWVIPKLFSNRNKYFVEEIKIDEQYFSDENNKVLRERYRYLLSRKHELGGIAVSFSISALVILILNLTYENKTWSWIYFFVIFTFCVLIWLSRNYSSANIDKYHKFILKKIKEKERVNQPL